MENLSYKLILKNGIKTILFMVILFQIQTQSLAATYYSIATGNWSSASTWSLSLGGPAGTLTPGTSDKAIVTSGKTVTITSVTNVSEITLNNGNLTLQANLTINNLLTLTNGTLNLDIYTLTYKGVGGKIARTSGTINASSGTMEFTNTISRTLPDNLFSGNIYNLTLNGSGGIALGSSITVTNLLTLTTGTLNLNSYTLKYQGDGGNITRTSGTINTSSGTMVFTNSISITLPANLFSGTIDNLTLNGNGGISLGSSITVTNLLTLTTGTLNLNSYTLTYQGAGGNITSTSGTIDASSGTMEFTNTISRTIPASLFTGNIKNFTLNGNGGINLGQSITVTNLLTLTIGTLNLKSYTLTYQGAGGNITSTSGTINASSGTMEFTNTYSRTLPGSLFTGSIYNLTLNDSGGITLGQSITVTNLLTLTTGTLNLNSSTLTYQGAGGNITRTSGTINASAGTIVFTNTQSRTLPANLFSGSIYRLTLNGSGGITLGQSITVTNLLTLTTGTLSLNTYTLTYNGAGGNIARSYGTINASAGTMEFTNTISRIIPASLFSGNIYRLTLNSSGGITLAQSISVTNLLTLITGTLNLNSKTLTMSNGSSIVRGDGSISGSPISTNGSKFAVSYTGATDIASTPELFPSGGGRISDLSVNLSNATKTVSISTGNQFLPLGNITVTSGILTLGNQCRVQPAKVVSTGSNGVINSNGKLILSAGNATTQAASIGNSSGIINGKVMIENYFPGGRRAYRLLCHPFSEALPLDSLIDDIPITGTGGAGNGFDATASNASSSFVFNEADYNGTTNSGWAAHATSHDLINSKDAIRIFYRGPRSQANLLDGSNPTPNECTIGWSGTVNQGDITVPLNYTVTNDTNAGWNLIANPYPSSIDLGAMASADRNDIAGFSVWIPGNGAKGSYITYTFGNSYILPAGAAFFVQTGAAGNFTFRESMKANAVQGDALHKAGQAEPNGMVMELWSDDTIWWDRWVLRSKALAEATFDPFDLRKLSNPDVSLYSLTTDNNKLSIDSRENFNTQDIIPLGFYSTKPYQFTIKVKDMDMNSAKPILIDHYLNKNTPLVNGTSYDFSTNSDPLSQGENRFEIIFENNTTGLVQPIKEDNALRLYPNPVVNGNLHVSMAKDVYNKVVSYTLYNLMGVQMASGEFFFSDGLNLENFQSGTYLLQLTIDNQPYTHKIVIGGNE